MKKLIIIAQSTSKGFTHQIAKTYKNTSLWYGDEVEIIDLYKEENKQPYLEFENMKILNDDPNRIRFQEKIKWADELVFIFPIWWGNMPAILKNFIDTNFEAGFAYKFMKGHAVPKKLLKGKTAKIYTTCDGYAIIYNNLFCPMYLEQYLKMYVFGVFGIEVTEYELYSKMRKKTQEEKDEILKKIELDIKAEKMKFSFNDSIHKILGLD